MKVGDILVCVNYDDKHNYNRSLCKTKFTIGNQYIIKKYNSIYHYISDDENIPLHFFATQRVLYNFELLSDYRENKINSLFK